MTEILTCKQMNERDKFHDLHDNQMNEIKGGTVPLSPPGHIPAGGTGGTKVWVKNFLGHFWPNSVNFRSKIAKICVKNTKFHT